MSLTRRTQVVFAVFGLAAIAGTAFAIAWRFREGRAPASSDFSPGAPGGPVSLTLSLSPVERSKILQALAKYDSAKPLRASDHFHRWCFDGLQGSYSVNSRLQRDTDQLLDQSCFRRTFPGSSPLFFRSDYGWEVRQRTAQNAREHREYEHHIDQFLATCAQIGAPLSLCIETDFGRISIGELLDASRRSFDNSQELCWTLVAYCSYYPEEPEWENRFGEQCSYESIVKEILSLPLDSGSCGGTHKQFALAYFLGSSAAKQLSEDLRLQCKDYLVRSTKLLEGSQLPNGAWGSQWVKSGANASDTQDGVPIRGIDLVRITGHQLEWIALAPCACRPPVACTSRAFRFLAESLDRADVGTIQKQYCAYSHAACVLQRALITTRNPLPSTGTVGVVDNRSQRGFSIFATTCEGSRDEAQIP
jgi:hypothetical protein